MRKVFVLGYFGNQNNQIDGQTIRTRSVYQLLLDNVAEEGQIRFYDTQEFKEKKMSVFRLFGLLLWCDHLIYLPGLNNLKKIFPVVRLAKRIRRFNMTYVAIGGWLHRFLKSNKSLIEPLKQAQGILVQSKELKKLLETDYQLENVVYFPNFRIHSFHPVLGFQQGEYSYDNPFKIVFMARIVREKGIDTIFNFVSYLKNRREPSEHHIVVDFYGPIAKGEEHYFLENVEKFDNVFYKGIVCPKDVYQVLSQYDLLLLPTRYPGEGFPGTILDAYISGVPVIVSDWLFLPEFVDHGSTGYVYNPSDESELFQYVDYLYSDQSVLNDMKSNAREKSKQFSQITAWEILSDCMNT